MQSQYFCNYISQVWQPIPDDDLTTEEPVTTSPTPQQTTDLPSMTTLPSEEFATRAPLLPSVTSFDMYGEESESTTRSLGDASHNQQNAWQEIGPGVLHVFFDHHIPDGIPIAKVYDPNNCYRKCANYTKCVGFDFDSTHNTCWLTIFTTRCTNMRYKRNCTHYRVRECCKYLCCIVFIDLQTSMCPGKHCRD